ncbi:putative methylated-DNA--protein-cysteine methyltransferase [Acanthamoeba castellanii mimivirus]|jgi:O-6-methylguanine DNA methyltransferase|uniref:Probable methylated-DNA--protein-cysteine methyltransferase n=5 Tax=Mimivirus TaxID=315393 RepID=MGMT_MIMIV|nr:DNA methyltransferase [Acanthamoeba polyphaga mimivirus]Q5UNU9.1 RecName: Full=Probable methylated-DNA--protein-cysteine methyltransferase; AltName: Full=6-O-methylguanine-DNA methyltransferase; Short=MGMT; AltName: Full=O-6-methylguanine-DNA-alkyltransferase [Acanthamoeba polyphaga mimivirus]AHA45142.1 putative methylated-DNA--protein-cysteine methyltransferase [Hirudovirus strain Sangsue]ALR84315.1 putative methylated-DNA--protein-cysteine methyltransferase [Niemeyer virus]AMK62000.1 methy
MKIEIIETKIGLVKIIYDDTQTKIISVMFIDSSKIKPVKNSLSGLHKYFKGQNDYFTNLDLELKGTPFQRKVWKQILEIPFGETRTYSDIAMAIGNPKAVRAVANACGANPIAIIVPCHRVVGKNNDGGYEYGLEKKLWLLDFEKKNTQ